MNETVRGAVTEALRDRYGRGVSIDQWGDVISRTWSWQVSLRIGGSHNAELLLKIPRWAETPGLEDAISADEQPAIAAEFDALKSIAAAVTASGDPGLTFVEPVAYLSSINAILMRRHEGRTLRRRIRVGLRPGNTEAVFGRTGRLIAVVHRIGGSERRPFDVAAVAAIPAGLASEAAGVGPAALFDSLQGLVAAAAALDGAGEPVGTVHGDLNLGNVLVDRADRVALIDPNPTEGPRQLRDVARLLGEIRYERRRLISAGWIGSPATRDRWAAACEVGSGVADEPTLPFYQALELGERWLRVETDTQGIRRTGLVPARRWLARELRQRVAALGG